MADNNGRPALPPYVSFRTFLNFLDRLDEGGVPQRIDRSYWGEFLAGGLGAQLMVGLRWLGLIVGETGEPTPLLDSLRDPDQRKTVLADLLRTRYAAIFASVDLMRGTPAMLDEVVRKEFKAEGDTHRKIIVFFIQAAQYAGIPVSERFTKRTRIKTATSRRAARGMNGNGQTGINTKEPREAPKPAAERQPGGNAKTVTFQGGGTVTLSVSVDLFTLNRSEREFVLDLIDRMNEFGDAATHQDELPGGDASRLEAMA